jgi:hypothetical protein
VWKTKVWVAIYNPLLLVGELNKFFHISIRERLGLQAGERVDVCRPDPAPQSRSPFSNG